MLTKTRTRKIGIFIFWLALGLASCRSKPESQTVVETFKQKVDADIQSHKSTRDAWAQTETESQEAGWYMEQADVPDSYSINVVKTDSLVSPYLGTTEFLVTGSVSYPKNSRQDALNATEFKSSYTVNHRLEYAYQDGSWVFKSEKCFEYDYFTNEHVWGDCDRGHGAHNPVMAQESK